MYKKILSQSAIYGLAPYIPKIAGIFTLPIITKYLTDVDYGIAGTIAAYTGAIAVFSTLGMNIVFTTSFYKSKCQYKWLWRQLYGFLQYWMIIFAILQSILLYFVIPEEAQENKWNIIFLANFSTIFFGATSFVGTMHYRLLQKPMPIAIRNIISGFITIFATLFFVAYLKMGYMGWYISSFISGCLINLSYWWVVNKKWKLSPIYKFKWRTIKKYLGISIPTIPHYYSSYLLTSSNRLVMDKLGIPIGAIGNYNLAAQFGGYFEMFAGAINMAVNPMAMEQIRNKDENTAKKMILFIFYLILLVTFLFSLWSKEIFEFLIKNDDLKNIYPLAIILVMAYNYRSMYIASTNMFFYHEKTKGLLKISTVAGILGFIGYIIVIPIWGIYGAAIVNFIFLQYMGYSGFFMKEYKDNTKVSYPYFKILFATLILTIAVLFLVEIFWPLKILVSIIFLAIIAATIKFDLL
ncbi:MAG: oligosaccharide flippase family protein [Prevotella sp.]|jgi:O-antigen/teichoic acid export membrane protein|nr:oligosaccharide flippase family protein [Prevotella sp.]